MGRSTNRRAIARNGRAQDAHRGRKSRPVCPDWPYRVLIGGTLFAIPFDLDKLETTGRSVPIIEGVRRGSGRAGATGLAHLAFSNTGSLVYVPAPSGGEQGDLVLFDRKGGTAPLKLPPGQYEFPRVSPEGSRIAFETNRSKRNRHFNLRDVRREQHTAAHLRRKQPLPTLVPRRPPPGVSIGSRRRSGAVLAAG